jgi:hypothetical protein
VCPSNGATVGATYVACFGRGDFATAPDQGDGVFFRNSRIRQRDISDGAMTILLGERATSFGPADWAGIFDESSHTAVAGGARTPFSNRSRVLGHTGPVALITPGAAAKDPLNSQTMVRHGAQISSNDLGSATICPSDFGGPHGAGTHFLFLDGTVRLINRQIDPAIYAGLATRAGSELVSGTDF